MPEGPLRRNVKISARAWQILRWSKYKLKLRNYRECLLEMIKNAPKSEDPIFVKDIAKSFDLKKHKIYIKEKVPKNENLTDSVISIRPKTVLLTVEVIEILSGMSNLSLLSGFSYSDAIEYLAQKNNLIPNNLLKND